VLKHANKQDGQKYGIDFADKEVKLFLQRREQLQNNLEDILE
jgi:hypothetical protein